jgi:DNA-binding CsgD family transcriptional regulator
MKRSAFADRVRAQHRSRPPARKRPRWTKEEIATLRKLYRTRSNREIARRLGRSVSSIVFKGYRLGLSKGIRRLKEMGRENINKRWHGR